MEPDPSTDTSDEREPPRSDGRTGRILDQEERKNVTILFADIVGSTSMVAERDPEIALEILRPSLRVLSEAVERYGGTVTRDTGDGLMAMFGAPLTDEEHALGGCCAALEMHAALVRSGLETQLRVGVHSGEVVVHRLRVGAVQTLNAAGEAVHLAARLQDSAAAGSTWISDATFALARGRVETGVVGPRTFRGFEAPVVVHLLQAVDTSLSRLDVAGRRGLSPFIDRSDELAVVENAHARAAEGHGCAVAIAGDAGVGKSRLIREFVAGRGGVGILEARCTRWRDDSGFHAIRALTGRLFGLDATDNAAAIHQRLEMAFGGPGAPPAEAFSAIAALHGGLPAGRSEVSSAGQPYRAGVEPLTGWASLSPNARRRQIIEACLMALLRAAMDKPLLVVIDDLHWADPDTEEVVERLLDQLDSHRLLLLLGWRSDYRPAWVEHPTVIHIALPPLSATNARDLARSVLRDRSADDAAVADLVERSGGNPFFIEEAAAMPDPVAVPPTVRSMLGARLDRLKPTEKQFIEVLATVGEPASADVLADLLNNDRGPELIAAELERAGLVRIDGIGESARFVCRHSLLQEVAYQGLTRVRRRALHAQIAAVMERLAGDRAGEEAAVLARHARLGEDWGAALRHARAAGARAASHSSNREAVRFYEAALEALNHHPEETATVSLAVDLRFDLREPLFRLGHILSLRARLDEAATLAERLGDTGRLGQLHIFQSHHAWLAGDYVAALTAADSATALADVQNDAALQLRAVFQRALAQLGSGDLEAAAVGMAEVAERAEEPELGGRFGLDAPLAVVALGYRTRALADLGQFAAAQSSAEACSARAAEVAQSFEWVFAPVAEGYLLLARGAAAEAVGRLTKAVAFCEQAEAELMWPVAQSFLGAAEVATGSVARGTERLEAAVSKAAAMGFLFQQPLRLALLAEALEAAGRHQEASGRAREALDLALSQRERASFERARRIAARTEGQYPRRSDG